MEDESLELLAAGVKKGSGTGRWNPTKEQINILESLYMQGIRTPSADQIQEITMRLKEYCHIEGKNVFYWFQNHKARQRQKQKQQEYHMQLRCFNGYLHFNNQVSCINPYYIPQREQLVFSPNYLNPNAVSSGKRKKKKKRSRPQKGNLEKELAGVGSIVTQHSISTHPDQTLDLFPLHPTGILQERSSKSTSISSTLTSADNSTTMTTTSSGSYGTNEKEHTTFFDFF